MAGEKEVFSWKGKAIYTPIKEVLYAVFIKQTFFLRQQEMNFVPSNAFFITWPNPMTCYGRS